MKIYMAVTTDRYELPLAISSKPTELSKKLGMNEFWAYKNLEYQKKLKKKTRDMHVIEVEI